MSDLQDLYQDMIRDHSRAPRNFRKLDPADREAEGYNPLCGDQVTIYVQLDGDTIRDVSFQGAGCAIHTASASMMTGALKGKSLEEANRLFGTFHEMLTGGRPDSANPEELGKLAVFSGVCKYPVRVKCATLAWHTFQAAVKGEGEPVSTE